MKEENIIKKVCKNIEQAITTLKTSKINKDDFFLIDTAIKELIQTRNTIDFIHKEQITPIDWNKVLKATK